MAKSGQYMPQRSQPLHFSGATTCGGWYPLELNAEERARTLVGQNSTQNPHALQRSTTMETLPFAIAASLTMRVHGQTRQACCPRRVSGTAIPGAGRKDCGPGTTMREVMQVTVNCEVSPRAVGFARRSRRESRRNQPETG